MISEGGEIIVGNPDNTEIGDRRLIPQFRLVDPPEPARVTFPRRSGKEKNAVDT